ncbi:MAG: 2-amino-4-hydroxy-6-hydroxymethyldihydropteridine diphosphokinase [Gemmobacter sp.]|nr:2-amino-4-hydroxy-6-hydroxymethyldihydropteridine diphosphokinase [Gemmobacter sp.]
MPVPTSNTVLIATGGNLDFARQSPAETLRAAAAMLPALGFRNLRISALYRTPCFPAGAGPDYVNGAIAADWEGTAAAALAALHGVEAKFGRVRDTRWGMRTLDLDLLAFGDSVLPDLAMFTAWCDLPADQQTTHAPDQLILPHPRLQDRGFVLVPLADIAPDWRHPVTGLTVAQMLAALPAADLAEIRPI